MEVYRNPWIPWHVVFHGRQNLLSDRGDHPRSGILVCVWGGRAANEDLNKEIFTLVIQNSLPDNLILGSLKSTQTG
jgi:hypothetical protein